MNNEAETVNAILQEIEDSNRKRVQSKEIDENTTQILKTSLSPEYKAIWNDVNIQGDYDQYARSTGPSRRLTNGPSPAKKECTPRSKENSTNSSASNDNSPRQKKTRVKLTRPKPEAKPTDSNQLPVMKSDNDVAKMKPDKVGDERREESLTESAPVIMHVKEDKTKKHTKAESINELVETIDKNVAKGQKVPIKETHGNTSNKAVEQLSAISATHQEQTDLKNEQKKNAPDHVSRNSNKSSKEFTPPIVTAVDFRGPAMEQAVRFATRNGLLVETPGNEHWKQEGTVSRLSTLFMANYLGVGYEPSPNIIESIMVKPILPPLRQKPKTKIRRRPKRENKTLDKNQANVRNSEDKNKGLTKPLDPNNLPPVRDAHMYQWKHNAVPSKAKREMYLDQQAPRVKYRFPRAANDTDSVFEDVVRWRSKVRYCGKPAMYRRITSPTLGEVALRRKLTDRLPTRQERKVRPDPKDLQPTDGIETWRRPSSRNVINGSVKQFIKQKLREAHQDGSMTSPTVIEGFYDVSGHIKPKNIVAQPAEVHNSGVVMSLPPPELPLRKLRPVWQRMR
ncbi:uncharacterized protein LOC143460839 [Clavelina lepadiformis]|uniref:uncharacterized protein LOC143460839 n=1 Tax=Clavelina lepadiformis TaxID=159417 RepID=UPI004042514B